MPDRTHDHFHDSQNDLLIDTRLIESVFDSSPRQNFSPALIDHWRSIERAMHYRMVRSPLDTRKAMMA
jgi:hypothetical protein